MNNLKAAREEMGLKQAELAALVQSVDSRIDVGMISRFENGVCLPTPIVARALARHLQASVVDLFSENYGFHPRVYGGILREECAGLLRTFFGEKR